MANQFWFSIPLSNSADAYPNRTAGANTAEAIAAQLLLPVI
ncbi:MAG: hypothetical protein O2890_05090 [Cyanobacteria bacterium]|nr:hypothetical protein [Cyanobacteriota bacterium]